MPKIGENETALCIRNVSAGGKYKHLPILAMTANGMNDYMNKPIDRYELIMNLKLWQTGGNTESSEPPTSNDNSSASSDTHSNHAIWNQQSALNRVLGKPDRLTILINMFQEDTPSLYQKLQTAMIHNDYATLQSSAHTLKGIAANLSAEQLTHAAHQLESAALAKNHSQCQALEDTLTNHIDKLMSVFNDFVKKTS